MGNTKTYQEGLLTLVNIFLYIHRLLFFNFCGFIFDFIVGSETELNRPP